MTREEVHNWAIPWVEGCPPRCEDAMVSLAMLYLHGFTMAYNPEARNLIHHGPPGVYVKSVVEIQADLDHWLDNCRQYDEDAQGWRERRLSMVKDAIAAERRRRGAP